VGNARVAFSENLRGPCLCSTHLARWAALRRARRDLLARGDETMRRLARIGAVLLVAGGMTLLAQTSPPADTLVGVKTKADIDALVAKIQAGELKGPQTLFDREKGPYRIYTSFIEKRKGAADIHAVDDEVFLIVRGSAIATLGGDVTDKKSTGENEFRGTTIVGGTTRAVGVGDIVSVPHGTAHQMDVGTGQVLYLVIKIMGHH
jgi:mannose-6-phosphate isomerase-like protein (cupin superfamily)